MHRYQCLKCKRTFRVYPRSGQPRTDITASERVGCDVVSVGVKLRGDLLGVRSPWGVPGKSRGYDAVQEAASRVPGLKRDQVFAGMRLPALGSDLTSVSGGYQDPQRLDRADRQECG